MVDIPTTEPAEIIAGDTLKWKREDLSADYPASSWTLTYELRGPQQITITATADGDDFSVSVGTSTTAGWTAGDYWWAAYVSDGTDRYRVDGGTLTIKPDLATTGAVYDGRSHAKKVLDAIEAVIEGRASKDQMSYTIAGRSLARTPIADLLRLRDSYKAEYKAEQKAEKIDRGVKTGDKILTRFV